MENLIYCKYKALQRTTLTGWTVLLALFLFFGLCRAEDGFNSTVPLHVVSDKMTVVKDESSAEFTGHVVVTRANAILKADQIKIYFVSGTTADSDNQIKQIIARGNVTYTSLDQKATADHAEYTAIDETLVLTGKEPKVTTGTSYVTGEKIIVYQTTGQVVVEGSQTRRVEAVFNPEDTKTKKN